MKDKGRSMVSAMVLTSRRTHGWRFRGRVRLARRESVILKKN